jgi:hypothetical protein
LDVWVGNLVTVVEEVDFRGVAARLAEFDVGIFAEGVRERARLNYAPTFGESEGLGGARKVKNCSNFLYPTGLLLASKEVDVHVLG